VRRAHARPAFRIESRAKPVFVRRKKSFAMDSRVGLDYIVENADYTSKLGAGKLLSGKLLRSYRRCRRSGISFLAPKWWESGKSSSSPFFYGPCKSQSLLSDFDTLFFQRRPRLLLIAHTHHIARCARVHSRVRRGRDEVRATHENVQKKASGCDDRKIAISVRRTLGVKTVLDDPV